MRSVFFFQTGERESIVIILVNLDDKDARVVARVKRANSYWV